MKNHSPTLGYALVNKETGKIELVSLGRPRRVVEPLGTIWVYGDHEDDFADYWEYRLIRVQIKPVASKRK